MNVGLIGFGKTGKAVARTLIREEGINLKWVIRPYALLTNTIYLTAL